MWCRWFSSSISLPSHSIVIYYLHLFLLIANRRIWDYSWQRWGWFLRCSYLWPWTLCYRSSNNIQYKYYGPRRGQSICFYSHYSPRRDGTPSYHWWFSQQCWEGNGFETRAWRSEDPPKWRWPSFVAKVRRERFLHQRNHQSFRFRYW